MSPALRLWLSLLVFLAVSGSGQAHKPSDRYLRLDVTEAGIAVAWDIALRDLDHAIGLDGNQDGAITWGELRTRHDAVAAYALARLAIRADGAPCAFGPVEHLVDRHTDGAYAVLRFAARCPRPASAVSVGYRLFFDLDPQHRGLLRIEAGGETQAAVLGPAESERRFDLGRVDPWRVVWDYVREGVRHIWSGVDHILFLVSLLLPAALYRQAGLWRASAGFGPMVWRLAGVVTAFTAAHSLTLSLAVVGAISLPSRLVETSIAASVALAALNNLRPVVTRRLWLLAFGFGLVHGLGFADALRDLGLPRAALAWALFAFNAGVEAGQLVVVAAVLPLPFALRRWRGYPRFALAPASLAIAALAGTWVVERAFGLALVGL